MSKSIILTDQGLELMIRGGNLLVAKQGNPIRTVKPDEMDQLVLMGRIELTSAAIAFVLSQGIDCVFMTKNGRFRGRLLGSLSKNVLLRVAQYRLLGSTEGAASLARWFVYGKITNQRTILMRIQRKEADESLAMALARMRGIREQALRAVEIESIMGYEGEASNLYFGYFARGLKNPEFFFHGRNRRPPKDPVNACLSFGYALLQTVIEGVVLEVGLDTFLGALHQPQYGRPSLVLDLMEEFRPIIVDMMVLRLLNQRQLTANDFGPLDSEEPTDDFAAPRDDFSDLLSDPIPDKPAALPGVYLKGKGNKVFVAAFYNRLRDELYYPLQDVTISLKQIITQQVYQLARVIKGEADRYQPFTID